MKILRKISLLLLSGTLAGMQSQAQDLWDLRRCVEYALQNNISVRQADIQKKDADLVYNQSLKSRIPNADFNTNTGLQFGRSIDPTTNLFTNQQLLFQGFQFNTSVTIFNWNQVNHRIAASRLETQASAADVEKTKNDLALSVATAYLTALLSKVQIDIVNVQLKQSQNQLGDTRKRVSAGSLPELNAVDLEAQVARDSSTVIGAEAQYALNLIALKTLLNIDASQPFAIAVPPVELIPVEPIADLEPGFVYGMAVKNFPQQKANELRRQSLERAIKQVKAGLYPSLFAFGGLASNFANSNIKTTGAEFIGYRDPSPLNGVVNVDGTLIPVQAPDVKIIQKNIGLAEMWSGWGSQISNNFRQNVGLGINVPIFSGYQARTNYMRSKLNLKDANLIIEQANLNLKRDIYNAYTNAVSSLQKFNASKSTETAAQRSFDFATRRYELGMLSTLELITSQTNLTRAKIDVANAQFDYVFRMKVLEFYKGQGIRL
jgi:outer membrane protein